MTTTTIAALGVIAFSVIVSLGVLYGHMEAKAKAHLPHMHPVYAAGDLGEESFPVQSPQKEIA